MQPPMEADCERAFSLAKLTLTTQRRAMDPKTLEMIQCLKNWLRRDAITLGGIYFKPATSAGGPKFLTGVGVGDTIVSIMPVKLQFCSIN